MQIESAVQLQQCLASLRLASAGHGLALFSCLRGLEGGGGESVVPPLEGRVVRKVLDQDRDALGVLLLRLAVQARDLVHQRLVLLRERPDVVVERFLVVG